MAGENKKDALQERISERFRELDQEPFYVMVWGPGRGDQDSYQKRWQLREHIASIIGDHQVVMSEDDRFQDNIDKYGLRAAEQVQAESCDAIIMIDTSIGPHTELTIFEDEIERKGLVFVPERHKGSQSFAAVAYNLVNKFFFNEEEFRDCHIIRQEVRNFVNAKRLKKRYRDKIKKIE